MVGRGVIPTVLLLASLLTGLGAASAATPPVPSPPSSSVVVSSDPAPGSAAPVYRTADASSASATSTEGTQTVTYRGDSSIFPNPERGWYTEVALDDYGTVYGDGFTLVMRYVRLDRYRSGALPKAFLDELASQFAATRTAGLKLVLRFAYNRSQNGADAPARVVLDQIAQLKPLLYDYTDVIAVVQAGFIGAYGEWHDSTHDLTSSANRVAITRALLKALPATRMVEIRSPSRADDVVPTPPDARNAFDGSVTSRVGQHNDCFLSTSNDAGTYLSAADRTYAKRVTTYTAMGGETCRLGGLSSRNDCPTSLEQLATYHWDYLNADYYTAIYDKWKKQGCYDEITRRLGYRYALTKVTAPTALAPGDPLGVTITLHNAGFGKLYNPRPLELALVPVSGGRRVIVTVTSDARRMLPLAGRTATIDVGAALPADTPPGDYDVFLSLPDASPQLAPDPRYAIRLANQGVWVAADGTNDLQLQIRVK